MQLRSLHWGRWLVATVIAVASLSTACSTETSLVTPSPDPAAASSPEGSGETTEQVAPAPAPVPEPVATEVPPSETTTESALGDPTIDYLHPDDATTVGTGVLVAISDDGSHVWVTDDDPTSESLGCEGTGPVALYRLSVDGRDRSRVPEAVDPDSTRIDVSGLGHALVTGSCEGYLFSAQLVDVAPNGSMSNVRTLLVPEVEQILHVDWQSTSGLVDLYTRSFQSSGESGFMRLTFDAEGLQVGPSEPTNIVETETASGVGTIIVDQGFAATLDGAPVGPDQVYDVVPSPSGDRIALLSGEQGLVTVSAGGQVDLIENNAVYNAVFAPAGHALLYRSNGSTIIANAEHGSTVVAYSPFGPLAINPTGDALYVTGSDTAGFVVRRIPFSTRLGEREAPAPPPVIDPTVAAPILAVDAFGDLQLDVATFDETLAWVVERFGFPERDSPLFGCGSGADRSLWLRGLTLNFTNGILTGWFVEEPFDGGVQPLFTTPSGTALGSSVAELNERYGAGQVEYFNESLGPEFFFPLDTESSGPRFLGGFLSGLDEADTVTALFAGTTCFFR